MRPGYPAAGRLLVIAIALMIALQLIVFRTKTGRAMRAVSFNLQSAKLMGINTDRIIMFTFALGSALEPLLALARRGAGRSRDATTADRP